MAVLRLLKAAIKNTSVELGRDPNEAELLEIILRQAKQRRESIEQYRAGGRDDLADREAAELIVLEDYLPKQLSDDETAAEIDAIIVEVGAESMKDMGQVMKLLNERFKGRIDGRKASEAVKAKLS
ncbi:GatB/YqeY domain-containing protein [Salidesulfovibrio brasiliensis]|uniref:GatB/YqeY domain-containing protein n=1 Tax=Salidesulfovibrio brasiliensis TaxID=221711 RepID=UPI000B18DD4D